jgi:hypothetical protein
VSAFETMKPVTAPITMTGIRSVCPSNNPSKRANVKGIGKKAHPAAAIPASTPTPCGMNFRISDMTWPRVPPVKYISIYEPNTNYER